MSPYTMQLYDRDDEEAPGVGDLFQVTEVEPGVQDLHWGRGTHVELEPCAATQRCGYCDFQAAGVDAFSVVTEHIKSCSNHPLAKALTKLAQTHDELAAVDEALGDFYYPTRAQQVANMVKSRDYWYKTCRAAEKERNKMRKKMQEQSDEVQELWLCPAEAEGLKRQLAQAQADLDAEPIEVEITGQEMVETLQAERQLRQEADEYVSDCRLVLTNIRGALDEHQVEGKYDASIALRISLLIQRAERAEVLAQLVTEELAELLERLAGSAQVLASRYTFAERGLSALDREDAKDARALAARIREALAGGE